MIINPAIGLFFNKYKLLFQIIGAVLAIIAVLILWNRFVAEPYREQGRSEIQAKWDKREKELALQHAENVKAARAEEQARSRAKELAANQRLKESQNENAELQASLDTERRANKRMRTITGKVAASSKGVSGVSIAIPGSDATCEAQLPAEIGAAFERLREGALRIGSEANQTAINLGESQRIHRINGGR